MDVPFFLFLLVLELIGAVIKPFALCMRLFANMVAGHVVLAVLISLIVASPVDVGAVCRGPCRWEPCICRFSFSNFSLPCLQAYIFTFLTTLFIASAVAPEH